MAAEAEHAIQLPPKLIPVFLADGKRVRGSFGGRGSAKTRSFAKMAAVRGAVAAREGRDGVIVCARQFMNSLADSSFAEVKAAIESDPWLMTQWEVGETYIRTRCRRVSFLFVGLARNLGSLKSKARILLCWVDEAEEVSEEAWITLIPTVREKDSEIWVTWNPRRKGSPTDKRFRDNKAGDVIIVEMNYQDNPWFPAVLERERLADLTERPEQYAHIWDGDYATAATGAYYAQQLLHAKQQGRIARVSADPLLPIRSYHDIGGHGAKADDYVIWVVQFVGLEIRVLDHRASRGQQIGDHAHWMRERGWDGAHIILPHDGDNSGGPSETWADAWRKAGFRNTRVIPNQGQGAKMYRVEATRRLFPRMWFNADTTEEGRVGLGLYAPKLNDRGVDLGPNHEFSHDADAFGLMAIDYKEPTAYINRPRLADASDTILG